MSQETSRWLNTRTLIGFTDKRGNAWHYRADEQGTEPNHYPLAIPTEDVRRRLFAWTHAEGDVSATYLGAGAVLSGARTYTPRAPHFMIHSHRPRSTPG